MGADFQVHILDGLDEEDLKIFFSQSIGSKYCPMTSALEVPEGKDAADWEDSDEFAAQFLAAIKEPSPSKEAMENVTDKVLATVGVWIGEASPLKAGLLSDPEQFIPSIVDQIANIIGEELPVITDDLINQIREAFNLGNTTEYKTAEKDTVISFFEAHKGRRAFFIFV